MFYKLSNTADLPVIEGVFDAKFKFPLLYRKAPLINGLLEQSLPILTEENQKIINYAIWGLLPQGFKEEWSGFQSLTNTLNISVDDLVKRSWTNMLLNQQRCLVLVSGFFTSFLYEGEIYPYYIYEKNHKPFALAGIYSELEDGFLSFSLLVSKANNQLKQVHNLGDEFPIALHAEMALDWLNSNSKLNMSRFIYNNKIELRGHTISKEFYKNDIIYEDLLAPATYENLPIHSLK